MVVIAVHPFELHVAGLSEHEVVGRYGPTPLTLTVDRIHLMTKSIGVWLRYSTAGDRCAESYAGWARPGSTTRPS